MERPSSAERRELSERYRSAVERVSALLFRADPMGIAENNPHTDEYAGEAQRIVSRFKEADSRADLARITHEVFFQMFSPVSVGPASEYQDVANDLSLVLQELRRR